MKKSEDPAGWMREYMKNRRAGFKSRGLCIVCGAAPAAGRTLCERHQALQRAAQRKYKDACGG